MPCDFVHKLLPLLMQIVDLDSGGGGVLALEIGRGVPPAWSKPDLSQFPSWLKRHPVPILKLTLNLIDWFMV